MLASVRLLQRLQSLKQRYDTAPLCSDHLSHRILGRWRLFRYRCPRCNGRAIEGTTVLIDGYNWYVDRPCPVCASLDGEEFVGGIDRHYRRHRRWFSPTAKETREVWWKRFIRFRVRS